MFLKCGHPTECERLDNEGEATCAWCDEVALLQSTIDTLREAIEGKAIVCRDGVLSVAGPIGYLGVYGGTVTIDTPKVISGVQLVRA